MQISVVVPVYNVETYIEKCINTILAQSFKDFELILVDDGSIDSSGVICDSYACKDNRITVIHNTNGGVSSARNTGIEHASGEYIVFIDADDYVGEDYLNDMITEATEDVFVMSDYRPFNDRGYESREYPEAYELDLNCGSSEGFRDMIFGFRLFPPYCKLYRNDIINNYEIRYNTEIKTAEDFDFNMRYIEHIDKIRYINSHEYMYRVGYKEYKPSNRGILGDSEIKSAHIMANGIQNFAQRLGIYNEVYGEICLWAANKHYFNRLRMLFRENQEIGYGERKKLYRRLVEDEVYHSQFKRGIKLAEKSTTRIIGCYLDNFLCWWIFYKLINRRN